MRSVSQRLVMDNELKEIKANLEVIGEAEFGTQFLKVSTNDFNRLETLTRDLKSMTNFGASGKVQGLESILNKIRQYNQ